MSYAVFQGEIITKTAKIYEQNLKEPLQFQPNLAQSTLKWRGLKLLQVNGHALSQSENITK